MKDKIEFEVSSGNVYKDLGLENADQLEKDSLQRINMRLSNRGKYKKMRIANELRLMAKAMLDLPEDTGKYGGDYYEISFKARGDAVYAMTSMIKHIADASMIGHSFEIVVDPDMPEYREKYFIDGDGADHIKDIKINGKNAKFKK